MHQKLDVEAFRVSGYILIENWFDFVSTVTSDDLLNRLTPH